MERRPSQPTDAAHLCVRHLHDHGGGGAGHHDQSVSFFWQASQEVEEIRSAPHQQALLRASMQAAARLKRINLDTWVGMAVSNGVTFFIMLTAAATLHA